MLKNLLRKFVIRVIAADFVLLSFTSWCIAYIEEWTDISQKQIERFLLGTILITGLYWSVMSGICIRHFIALSVGLTITCLAVVAGTFPSHLRDHRRDWRMRLMLIPRTITVRIFMVATWMIFLAASFEISSFRYYLVYQTSRLVFEYVVSLPSGGEPGRRRRDLLKKLSDLMRPVPTLVPGIQNFSANRL